MEKFSVSDIPKIILDDKIIFYGLPKKEEILEILWGLLSLYWNWIILGILLGFKKVNSYKQNYRDHLRYDF